MELDFSKFVLKNEIRMTGYTILLGELENVPTLLKVTFPRVEEKDLTLYTSKEHLNSNKNDVYESCNLKINSEVMVDVIYPASQQGIEKFLISYKVHKENYNEYLSLPHTLCWVDEFMKNQDDDAYKVFYKNEDFIIVENLKLSLKYCILKNSELHSIRDLKSCHLSVIENAKEKIYEIMEDQGVKREKLLLYFDYIGKTSFLYFNFWTITRSFANFTINGRFIYLDDLLKNIRIAEDYYKDDIVKLVKNSSD